jgi:AcrR family transcriptional regulator
MPYRRTDKVRQQSAVRHQTILKAAQELAGEGGMAAVQIVPVAARAGIAVGTVYRYFPAKTALVAALVAALGQQEEAALGRAGDGAPGPLSALAAVIATFAVRALAHRRLAYALLAEPVETEIEAVRAPMRAALAQAFDARVRAAVAGGHLPSQDASVAVVALVGALVAGTVGPLAPDATQDPAARRTQAQALTLWALRALGVADARARGLVVQVKWPG